VHTRKSILSEKLMLLLVLMVALLIVVALPPAALAEEVDGSGQETAADCSNSEVGAGSDTGSSAGSGSSESGSSSSGGVDLGESGSSDTDGSILGSEQTEQDDEDYSAGDCNSPADESSADEGCDPDEVNKYCGEDSVDASIYNVDSNIDSDIDGDDQLAEGDGDSISDGKNHNPDEIEDDPQSGNSADNPDGLDTEDSAVSSEQEIEPADTGQNNYFKVAEESMNPLAAPGTIIELVSAGYQDGDMVIAQKNDGTYIVKMLQGNQLVSLGSGANYTTDDVTILGSAALSSQTAENLEANGLTWNDVFAETSETPGGSGTSESPYQIENWQNLYWLSQNNSAWDKYYQQIADIAFPGDHDEKTGGIYDWDGGKGWTPIGTGFSNDRFTGTYNGSGFTISNLFINRPDEQYVGLFGSIGEAGIVTNLNLDLVNVTGGSEVGALAGRLYGTISDIEVNGVVKQLEGSTVAGNPLQNIGGLVGVSWSGAEISDAHFDGTVTSYGTHSGGLVGNNSGTITASSTSGTVEILTNLNNAGGLVGSNMVSGEIISSSSTAAINSSGEYIGGLVGANNGNIIESRAEGCVTASGNNRIGGLVGYNKGSIEGSSAFGNVIATNESAGSIGGLVGRNESGGSITSSHSAGNVTANGQWISSVGGLVGLNSGSIAESSATGGVTATGEDALYIGGLIGWNSGTVESSFFTGNVEGNTQTGGLVGYNSNRISNCYVTGNVRSNGLFVGGLVGTNTGTIEYCYAAGDVEGDEYVGGLVGSEGGFTTLKHSFASGNVIGNDSVGALAGQIAPGGLVRYCGASGDVNNIPVSNNAELLIGNIETIGPLSGEAYDNYILNTVALKQLATFLGEEWSIALLGNFNPSNPSAYIWYIDQGTDYPILWWQLESSGGNGGIDRGTGFRPSSFHFTPLSWAGLPVARSNSALTNIFTSENSIITPAFVSSGTTGDLVRAQSAYQATLQRFEAEMNQLNMKEKALLETELVLAKTAIIALETALLVQRGETVDLPALLNAYQEALSTLQANRNYFSTSELAAAEALLTAIESTIASLTI